MSHVSTGKSPQLDVDKVREALVAFYAQHNPDRISSIDPILEKYCGYEVELLKSLKDKYNVTEHLLIDNLLASGVGGDDPTVDSIVIYNSSVNPSSHQQQPLATLMMPADSMNISDTGSYSSPDVSSKQKGFDITPSASSSTFAGLSSIGLTNAAGRLLSGVSWGLNNESFAFAPSTSESDLSSSTKLFRMQAEIERLEQEKVNLESTIKKLTAQIVASNEVNVESKELELKEQLANISSRLLTQLESINHDKNLKIGTDDFYPSHIPYSARQPLESRSHEQLISESLYVRELLEILRMFAMDIVSKNLVDSQVVTTERGIVKDKLTFFCQKIGIDWANLDKARDEVFVAQRELEKLQELIRTKDAELDNCMKTIELLKNEIKGAKEYIEISNTARQQISKVCGERIMHATLSSDERVQTLAQALLLEREEVLSNLSEVSLLQQHWQIDISNEQIREIARLRDELTKSRRQEAQREREVTFLQRQLQEAANRLARFEESDNHTGI